MATTRILLLRGVNVGGNGKLPMAEFRETLAALGLGRVRSYIQSGNLVFDDAGLPDLQTRIAQALKAQFGLTSALFLYSAAEFDALMQACPFSSQGDADGAKVHVFYLDAPSPMDLAQAMPFATTEQVLLTQSALYLFAPDGIGRSVLVEKLGRLLKVGVTARNWNTVRKLSEMAKA